MKRPIIFLSVFLVLYTLNILFLYKTSGVSLIPSPQAHSKDTLPLLAKSSSSTFNPIPLALIKDSPIKENTRYIKQKEGVVIPNVTPPVRVLPTAHPKEAAVKAEVKQPKYDVKDYTKNTPDFAPNPPEGYAPPVPAQTVKQDIPAALPPAPAEPAKPIVTEQAKPKTAKEEVKAKPVPAQKYKELTDKEANNSQEKNKAFVQIQNTNEQKAAKVKEAKAAPSVKEVTENKKLPAKQPVTKEQPKPQEVKTAPAPVVQEAPKPAPAPAKPDNSAKLEAADLVDIESLPIEIFLDIRYATSNNFTGQKLYNHSKCYLNKNVAQAFVKAVFYAQAEGLYFRIYDCYRPSSVQQIMWDKEDNGRFLSSPEKGSNHSRGAAIDLGLCDASGKVLPAPTGFDNFTNAAAFNAKEGISDEAIKNRTKLQEIMKKAGFTTIKNEWWHFDYKDAKSYQLLDISF